MEKLRKRYEDYVEQAIMIRKKAGPLAGIFGLSNGPQDDPAHVIFYEDVQKWVADFMKTDPDGAASFEAARFLICASAEMGQADSYWMMYAAQGLARVLIPRLTAENCRLLQNFYDENYPAKERMPVQKDLYKQLKKGAKGR